MPRPLRLGSVATILIPNIRSVFISSNIRTPFWCASCLMAAIALNLTEQSTITASPFYSESLQPFLLSKVKGQSKIPASLSGALSTCRRNRY
jgi:hypothetical protein